jgi:hypothetical protein
MLVMLTRPHTLVVTKFAAVVSNRSSSKDGEVPLLRTQCGLSTWATLPNSTSTHVAWAKGDANELSSQTRMMQRGCRIAVSEVRVLPKEESELYALHTGWLRETFRFVNNLRYVSLV